MTHELSSKPADDFAAGPKTLEKKKSFPLNKPLLFWVRLILGAIFILASAHKIYQPDGFAKVIYNYQLLPDALINITALILPWVELLLGCFLILGLWLPGAVTLANLLLVTFSISLIFNLARGLDVHCGCFSNSGKGSPATAWYFARDALFLLMGGYLFFKGIVGRSLLAATGKAYEKE